LRSTAIASILSYSDIAFSLKIKLVIKPLIEVLLNTKSALLGDNAAPPETKNQKILIVDDFANVRKSIKSMLNELGYDSVFEAGEGNSATKAVKEMRFSLILCDFNLGKGRDGARLLEEWRTKKLISQETVFVMITADTSREVVISSLEFQPDDYLAKPFAMDVLAGRLERWFDRRRVLLPMFICAEKEDWSTLSQLARSIMELHPRYRAFAQKMYAEALIKQNKYTEAENFLYGLLEKRYQGWVQVAIHEIEILQDKLSVAEVGLKQVLLKEPSAMGAYDLLVTLYKKTEQYSEVQNLLEQAISRAPRSIHRHRELAKVAQRNLDFTRSNKAYKDAISLSEGTMHESLGTYQKLVDGLEVEVQLDDLSENRRRDIQKDLSFVSKKITDRFQGSINAKLFNDALKLRKENTAKVNPHHPKLNQLFSEMFANIEEVIPETAYYVTETFYFTGRLDDGDEVVKRLRERFKDNPEFLMKLDTLQSEPISHAKRKEAHDLNSKGIEHYKLKEYSRSIELFLQALAISPSHPGMILNFVQSKLQNLKHMPNSKDELKVCSELLQRLDYLPEQHYQFERFSKLKKTVTKLSQEA
jgi:DNA-binding response OmpR family regulator